MKAVLTKSFRFSASTTRGGRILGKNFILDIALEALSVEGEEAFEKKTRDGLIRPLESVDLGLHVDFLKGVEITDLNLLKAFWREMERLCPEFKLLSMTLRRDESTRTTLSFF